MEKGGEAWVVYVEDVHHDDPTHTFRSWNHSSIFECVDFLSLRGLCIDKDR